MGDPKKARSSFDRPVKRWDGERIKQENEIIHKYGLANKKEVWRAYAYLRQIRHQARKLMAELRTGEPQAKLEEKLLLARLDREGLMPSTGNIADVLSISLDTIFARRLQTQVFMKGLANTPKQARQLIVHGHIIINGRKMNVPGYLLKRGEEEMIEYHLSSPMLNPEHPMRPKPQGAAAPAAPAAAPADATPAAPAAPAAPSGGMN